MKTIRLLSLLCLVLSVSIGCSTMSTEEKAAEKAEYIEGGGMDNQVESWEKHGRH